MNAELGQYIPWLSALAAVLCGLCSIRRSLKWLAAPICIAGIALAFLISVGIYGEVAGEPRVPDTAAHGAAAEAHLPEAVGHGAVSSSNIGAPRVGRTVPFLDWIHIGDFHADFAYYFDGLTMLMLFVVTGIGTLVAIYAAGYMKGDRGYARFFAFVSLFIFAMTNLVMADNLVLLYLGWEGVGLCSYLLIGFYYEKPSAVAAAKKAFIVNRIGDLGFALGIFWAFQAYGTVEISAIVAAAQQGAPGVSEAAQTWIPFVLMLGAFGKSAQIPLYVWLPDAMEGPTPVSALIHAATMVTAGVYMIARLLPVFALSPAALPTVAVVGGVTAIFAATIALCQYDIKRIFAYSTISQLGYMFVGVGVLSAVGGVFHLFTHAFFKALLFLTAASVMHALAGQLDLRKMSGLRHKMPVTCWLMFVGCLALAGFPFLSGFYSKDLILSEALMRAQETHSGIYYFVTLLGLITAFLTAFYTFRLWFRVFGGPEAYEIGHEHHGVVEESEHPATADHPHTSEQAAAAEPHRAPSKAGEPGSPQFESRDRAATADYAVEHHHEPHEMPWYMNAPLVVLAIGSIVAGWSFLYVGERWVQRTVGGSTATMLPPAPHDPFHTAEAAHAAHYFYGVEIHLLMMWASGIIAIAGILLAAYFHLINRSAADAITQRNRGLVRLLANKYYVDELNDRAIVRPLRLLGHVLFAFDAMVIGGLVSAVGLVPRLLGTSVRPAQSGALQGYGVGMVFGLAALLLLVLVVSW